MKSNLFFKRDGFLKKLIKRYGKVKILMFTQIILLIAGFINIIAGEFELSIVIFGLCIITGVIWNLTP